MTRHAPAHRAGPTPGSSGHPGHHPPPRFSRALVIAVGGIAALLFVLAGVALAYLVSTDSSHPAEAVAATLAVPTSGAQNGTATPSSVPIAWTAPAGYPPTGYTVLRCTGSECTNFTAISNGTCSGTISGTSCADTDTGLAAGTTYTYEVEAQLDNWVSSPGSSFTAATSAVTKLVFATQPSSGQNIQATGTGSFTVSVSIEDANGNVATHDNTDTVTLAIATGDNPGSGILSCTGGLTATVSSGVASFTGCAITKAGTGYELTASSATDASLTAPANANSFNITTGNVSLFVVGGVGSTATAGTPVTGVTLTAEDADGNRATGYSGSKSITWSGPASSPNETAPTLPVGTVSFSSGASTTSLGVTFTGAGSQTLTATQGSITGSASTTVSAGNVSLFVVGGVGSTATAGTPVTGVTLTAEDADGNRATGYSGSKSITWSGPASSPNETAPTLPVGTVSFSSGASTTSLGVTFTGAGSQTLTATQGSITGSASTTVSAGNASGLGFTTQPSTGQNIQVTGSFSVSVAIEDSDGNTVTSGTGSTDSVTLAIATNPGAGVLSCTNSGDLTLTASAGVASLTGCAITKTGTGYTLTASDNTHTSYTAPANANSFDITAATASKLAFTTQPSSGQNVQATGTGSFSVSVAIQDSDGNTVTSGTGSTDSVTLAIATNPGAGVLSCTNSGGLTVTASAGVASFTGCAITEAGTGYTLTATDNTRTLTAPANANSFNITAGTFTHYAVGVATTATAGTATGVTLTAEDANGNTVTSYNASNHAITWTGPQTSPDGTAPALPNGEVSFSDGVSTTSLSVTFTDAGSQTLTSTDGSSRTGSATVTVSGAAPASLVLANCSVTSGITPTGCASSYSGFGNGTGDTLTAYVQALDQYGNAATISNTIMLSVSSNTAKYSITAGTSLTISGSAAPANQSTGTFTVEKTGNGNQSATITVAVTSGASGINDLTFAVAS